MAKKPQAKKNLAKDVVKPKVKKIDIPEAAKAEIARMTQNLDTYITGIAAGLGIEGKWAYDMREMKILVKDKE